MMAMHTTHQPVVSLVQQQQQHGNNNNRAVAPLPEGKGSVIEEQRKHDQFILGGELSVDEHRRWIREQTTEFRGTRAGTAGVQVGSARSSPPGVVPNDDIDNNNSGNADNENGDYHTLSSPARGLRSSVTSSPFPEMKQNVRVVRPAAARATDETKRVEENNEEEEEEEETVTIDAKQLAQNNTVTSTHYDELLATIEKMTAKGKGVLAADEAVETVGQRFASIGLENTAENRRKYRAVMCGTEGIEAFISGVALQEETLSQTITGDDGDEDAATTFPKYLAQKGIVTGVKTDRGLQPFYLGAPGEECTAGLDGYLARAQGYYEQGARFSKFRTVFKIQNGTVSEQLIMKNAETLADYAYLSQLAGLVPLVEPEVMIDGPHSIAECQAVSQRVWAEVMHQLHARGVIWEAMLFEPNMIVPGNQSEEKETVTPEEVAHCTLQTLTRVLLPAVPGVTFLSGGLPDATATAYLNAINSHQPSAPWNMSFAFARALQASALMAWAGDDANLPAARQVFLHRARMNGLANTGEYTQEAEEESG